jgi:hypothetical protein
VETGVASRLTVGKQEEQLDEQTRRFREQVRHTSSCLCELVLAAIDCIALRFCGWRGR